MIFCLLARERTFGVFCFIHCSGCLSWNQCCDKSWLRMKCQTPGRFRWYPARQKNHLLGKNNIQRWQTVCQLKSVPICRVHFLSQWLLNSWCKNGSQSFKRFHTRERSCAISGLRHKELVLDDYAMRPADEYRACDLAQSGLIFQNRTTQKTARMPLAAMTIQ